MSSSFITLYLELARKLMRWHPQTSNLEGASHPPAQAPRDLSATRGLLDHQSSSLA